MSKLLTILIAVFAAGLVARNLYLNYSKPTTEPSVPIPALVQQIFETWKVTYGKSYNSDVELLFRLETFYKAYTKIESHNASGQSYQMGLNRFADLTPEEFRNQFLRKFDSKFLRTEPSQGFTSKGRLTGAPEGWNWADKGVTGPIRDLMDQDQPWIFPVLDTLQSFTIIQQGAVRFLSSQQMIDCMDSTRMSTLDSVYGYVVKYGLELEKDYVPRGTEHSCAYEKESVAFRLKSFRHVVKADNDSLKASVLANPVTVGINASKLMYYVSGIYADWTCDKDGIDTSMILIGYGKVGGQGYWNVQANWGTTWGESGYIRLARKEGKGVGICGITEMAAYPTA
jgi:hypothetical protein